MRWPQFMKKIWIFDLIYFFKNLGILWLHNSWSLVIQQQCDIWWRKNWNSRLSTRSGCNKQGDPVNPAPGHFEKWPHLPHQWNNQWNRIKTQFKSNFQFKWQKSYWEWYRLLRRQNRYSCIKSESYKFSRKNNLHNVIIQGV